APAVDAQQGLVIVDNTNGTLVALDYKAHALKWSVNTVAPYSQLVIDRGRVYFMGSNLRLYGYKDVGPVLQFQSAANLTAGAAPPPVGGAPRRERGPPGVPPPGRSRAPPVRLRHERRRQPGTAVLAALLGVDRSRFEPRDRERADHRDHRQQRFLSRVAVRVP